MPKASKDIHELIQEVGKYSPDAFQFVQEGLNFTVHETHGEETEAQQLVIQYMRDRDLDIEQLETLYINDKLPEEILELIDEVGGIQDLNRHVSGQRLCWGLRNYALAKWGALATTVLQHWNIRTTRDFGEIVFALVEHDFLQKQSGDSIADFEEVFDFEEAFDRCFNIDLNKTPT